VKVGEESVRGPAHGLAFLGDRSNRRRRSKVRGSSFLATSAVTMRDQKEHERKVKRPEGVRKSEVRR